MAKKRTKLNRNPEYLETQERLRSMLRIDKHDIDNEIEKQPSLFFEISQEVTASAARRDYLKEQLQRVDAKLDSKYRRKAVKQNTKFTESQIAHMIILDDEHVEAANALIDARQHADTLQALKESFHQRSYMLRDLSSLFIANYYERSSLKSDKDVRGVRAKKNIDAMDEMRQRVGSRKSLRSKKKD